MVSDATIIFRQTPSSLFMPPSRLLITPNTYEHTVGTPYYLAPEYPRGDHRTGATLLSSDIWSIGVIAFILVTGKPPFNAQHNKEIFRKIWQDPLKFPDHVELSDSLKHFITMMLNKDPTQRPSASTSLEHPWVTGKVAYMLRPASLFSHQIFAHVSPQNQKSQKPTKNRKPPIRRSTEQYCSIW